MHEQVQLAWAVRRELDLVVSHTFQRQADQPSVADLLEVWRNPRKTGLPYELV